jgi:hypothetical protein
VSSKILWAGVAPYKTLKFKARADLILGRVEDGQGVREEPAAERRQGELVPDNLGQQNGKVKFVPEREDFAGLDWAEDAATTIHCRSPFALYPLCAATSNAGGSSGMRRGAGSSSLALSPSSWT